MLLFEAPSAISASTSRSRGVSSMSPVRRGLAPPAQKRDGRGLTGRRKAEYRRRRRATYQPVRQHGSATSMATMMTGRSPRSRFRPLADRHLDPHRFAATPDRYVDDRAELSGPSVRISERTPESFSLFQATITSPCRMPAAAEGPAYRHS